MPDKIPFQFTFSEIDNGFIVQHPDYSIGGVIIDRNSGQKQPNTINHHVEDFESFISYMKKIWPKEVYGN